MAHIYGIMVFSNEVFEYDDFGKSQQTTKSKISQHVNIKVSLSGIIEWKKDLMHLYKWRGSWAWLRFCELHTVCQIRIRDVARGEMDLVCGD